MFDFLSLKKAVSDLSGAVRSKTEELENLRRERDRIGTAPGTREDVTALIAGQISERADRYTRRLESSLKHQLEYGNAKFVGVDGGDAMAAVVTAREHVSIHPSVYDVEESLCFLFKDQLIAGVTSALNQMQWPSGAEPLHDRVDRIAKLDKKITAAEDDLKALREQAASAGILV